MNKIIPKGVLCCGAIFLFGFSASAEEVSFSDFAELKSRAISTGETVGRLQACENANGGRLFGSDLLISKFREHMEKTSLPFEIMEKLDTAMLEAANSEKDSTGWISKYKDFDDSIYSMSECVDGDVCCLVEAELKVVENRLGDFFSKY